VIVLAQTLIDDLVQQIVVGDDLVPHPMHAAEHQRRAEAGCSAAVAPNKRKAPWGSMAPSSRFIHPEQRSGWGYRYATPITETCSE